MRASLLLLMSYCIVGAASHRLLRAENDLAAQHLAGRELSEEGAARQRIFAELEQVHQLRERMLQEGNLLHTAYSLPACMMGTL